MTRRVWDTFMFNNEFDILECRIRELEEVPNLVHVVVEADVDHQDHPKPYHFAENRERFAQWSDRIVSVQATGLPTLAQDPDPWSREHAQREHVWAALSDAASDDVVLHGDVDEFPTALAVRNFTAPGWSGFKVCHQRLFCFAVDWEYPGSWPGTVVGHVGDVGEFADMRSMRGFADALPVPLGGWHLSWLGGGDAARRKMGSFCHPEVRDILNRQFGDALDHLDQCYLEGWHVDGKKLLPVDVDETWPKWIAAGDCPDVWFRPR